VHVARTTVSTSVIVRVVESRDGLRIMLQDLRTSQLHEFRSFEEMVAFLREVSQRQGLR